MPDRAAVLGWLRCRRYAVVSTVGPGGEPQGALVGIGVTDDLELVFDTAVTSRKYANVRRDPRVAVVVGAGETEITVQLEGVARVPVGEDLARLRAVYFAAFPDGRDRAADPLIAYVAVRPTWLRYSDHTGPVVTLEITPGG